MKPREDHIAVSKVGGDFQVVSKLSHRNRYCRTSVPLMQAILEARMAHTSHSLSTIQLLEALREVGPAEVVRRRIFLGDRLGGAVVSDTAPVDSRDPGATSDGAGKIEANSAGEAFEGRKPGPSPRKSCRIVAAFFVGCGWCCEASTLGTVRHGSRAVY